MFKNIGEKFLRIITFGWDTLIESRQIQAENLLRYHGYKLDAKGIVSFPLDRG